MESKLNFAEKIANRSNSTFLVNLKKEITQENMKNQLKMEIIENDSEYVRVLKDEFIFKYNKQDIKVKLCGSVYCAIFGDIAKPLDIEILGKESIHNGKIKTKEGKHLGFIPDDCFEKVKPINILTRIKTLLTQIEL